MEEEWKHGVWHQQSRRVKQTLSDGEEQIDNS